MSSSLEANKFRYDCLGQNLPPCFRTNEATSNPSRPDLTDYMADTSAITTMPTVEIRELKAQEDVEKCNEMPIAHHADTTHVCLPPDPSNNAWNNPVHDEVFYEQRSKGSGIMAYADSALYQKSNDWRTPFSSPDPMSLSIDAASTFILQEPRQDEVQSHGSKPNSASISVDKSGAGSLLGGEHISFSHKTTAEVQRECSVPMRPSSLSCRTLDLRPHRALPKSTEAARVIKLPTRLFSSTLAFSSSPVLHPTSPRDSRQSSEMCERGNDPFMRATILSQANVLPPERPASPSVQSPDSELDSSSSAHDIEDFEIGSEPGSACDDIRQDNRLDSVVKAWNEGDWNEVELLIRKMLARRSAVGNDDLTRRLRHLLAVAVSLRGDWRQAKDLFLEVLRTSIDWIIQPGSGVCAALYWLADLYVLLDRRAEALLAYTVCERGPLFQGESAVLSIQCLRAEHAACQSDVTRSDLRRELKEAWRGRRTACLGSIFAPTIMPQDGARALLDANIWDCEKLTPHSTVPGRGTAKNRLRIDRASFKCTSSWPAPCDPYFRVANVVDQKNRRPTCDLTLITKQQVPKLGAWSSKGMGALTCPDLPSLIVAIRECLRELRYSWREISVPGETGFGVWYTSLQEGVATRHFFSIDIFQLTLRSGFGVEICPRGVTSSRVVSTGVNIEDDLQKQQLLRIRKRIRVCLDVMLARREAKEGAGVVLPIMSINGMVAVPQIRP